MATVDTTMQATRSWRDIIHITRSGIFSVLFLLLGLWILLWATPQIEPGTVTTLTFGKLESGDSTTATIALDVTVAPYMVVVGVFYLAIGIAGLLPGDRLGRARFGLMLLAGVLIPPTILIIAAAGQSTNAMSMLTSSLRLSTPIVIGALAGIWCERSGVVNIAIEGMMLTGAAFGFIAFSLLTPPMDSGPALFIGVIVAVLAGGVMAALHAWLSISFKTDQIVSGTVINILAIGLTSFMRREILLTAQDAGRETIQAVPIPVLKDIPVVSEIFANGKPIFYLMFVLLIVTHVVLFYTRWGLRTRAVGENPHAADTLGINVIRTRWINVVIGGMIAGLAGAWLTLETAGTFDDNMTTGRGFIALAAMIFGKWLPFGAFGGGLLFGFSSALQTRFQILGATLPPQFLQMTPYLVTIVVLAGLVGRSRPPAADGVPYEKE